MLNYAGCHACQSKSYIDPTEKTREEEEGGKEESITYKRTHAYYSQKGHCIILRLQL